jgi:hypothetical protein
MMLEKRYFSKRTTDGAPHRHLNGLTPNEQWNAVNPYEMLPKRIKKVSLWNGLLKGYTLDYK